MRLGECQAIELSMPMLSKVGCSPVLLALPFPDGSRFGVEKPTGRPVAIEVKGSAVVSSSDAKGLVAFGEEKKGMRKILVCEEMHARETADGVEILPVPQFLESLWAGELI